MCVAVLHVHSIVVAYQSLERLRGSVNSTPAAVREILAVFGSLVWEVKNTQIIWIMGRFKTHVC